MTVARVFILTHDDQILGAFQTVKHADAVKAALGENSSYRVEPIAMLPADVKVETVATVHGYRFQIHWDGTVRQDLAYDPRTITYIAGLPDSEPMTELPPGPCALTVAAFEQDYTLGVTCSVTGNDDDACRRVFIATCAQLKAAPAQATVEAWVARHSEGGGRAIPDWVWRRPENAGIIADLKVKIGEL